MRGPAKTIPARSVPIGLKYRKSKKFKISKTFSRAPTSPGMSAGFKSENYVLKGERGPAKRRKSTRRSYNQYNNQSRSKADTGQDRTGQDKTGPVKKIQARYGPLALKFQKHQKSETSKLRNLPSSPTSHGGRPVLNLKNDVINGEGGESETLGRDSKSI